MINMLNIANREERITNSLIDTIIFVLLWLIISMILFALGLNQVMLDEENKEFPLIFFCVFFPIYFFYFYLLELKFYRTIGKYVTKTIVVAKDGGRPTKKMILIRTFSRLIPFEYLSFLYKDVGLHDILSDTRVIKCEL